MRSLCILFLLHILANAIPSIAQIDDASSEPSPAAYCGADAAQESLYRTDARMRERSRAIDEMIAMRMERAYEGKHLFGAPLRGSSLYSIPVVVHIVHNDGAENLTDDQVRAAIRSLNDAFANIAEFDSTSGVPVEIRFCLARQDERGKATTGITRVRSALTELVYEREDGQLKALDRWDPTRYLNIWVVRSIESLSNGPSVSGYAYAPTSHGSARDGIVLEASLLDHGTDPLKILVHEIGHYLGLYHTFQTICLNGDCLRDGDRICDTPPDASATTLPCGAIANTCTTDVDDPSVKNPFRAVTLGGIGDQNDLPDNYMDYGLQECRSAFTNGQRERMIAMLTTVRASLLASRGCDDPCSSDLEPVFTPGDTSIDAGATLRFVNGTAGATRYEWQLDGKTIATTVDLSLPFKSKGSYTITLIAYSGDSTCARARSITIDVRCPMSLDIAASRTTIQPGESVDFTSTITGASSVVWLIDDVVLGTNRTLSHFFNVAGAYQVYLVGFNGVCYDTSNQILIRVGACQGGKEESLWYFGRNAGLDFRGGSPVARVDGAIYTNEGSAAICDADGTLLFYSDGKRVVRRDHYPMENGSDIGGSLWAAQGCMIVKAPSSDSLYYLFTAGNWADTGYGLRYSVIDMSRNGGLGAVTSRKNILLNAKVSERIAAVYHANCLDVWIVAHEQFNSRFVAYRLSRDGVDTVPVVTEIGSGIFGENRYGCIKFSPDGKRLVSVLGGISSQPAVELYDFDMMTGKLSNYRVITIAGDTWAAYSGEFSPNGRYLYVTALNGDFVNQYDLQAGDITAVRASKVDVASGTDRRIGLALAPDGRIYVTRKDSPYLDVIDLPNNAGSGCRYRSKGLNLAGHVASISLPGYVAGYIMKTVAIEGDRTQCIGGAGAFTASGGWCSRGSYLWSVTGPATIRAVGGPDIELDFTGGGRVTLYLDNRGACSSLYDTLTIDVPYTPRLDLGSDISSCDGEVMLDAGAGFISYRWQDGSTARTLAARSSGLYWVEVAGDGGCLQHDTIAITVTKGTPSLDLGRDTAICGGEVVTLDAGENFLSYIWQDGSDSRYYSAFMPGRYWVSVVSPCADTLSDTITIAPRTEKLVDLGDAISLCPGTTLQLSAGPPEWIYRWSTGATTPVLQVRDSGMYWVYATNGWCESRDSVQVSFESGNLYELSIPDMASIGALPLDTEITLPLRLRRISGYAPPQGLKFSGTIRFNRTTLLPVGSTSPRRVLLGERSISFSGVTGVSDTLELFTFRTMLGDSEATPIMIDDFSLDDPCLKDVRVRPGSVAVAVCRAGGAPRLVTSSAGAFGMAVPAPNPAETSTEICYTLVERGRTRLDLFDLLGRRIMKVHEAIDDPGSYAVNIDTRDLPSGIYIVILESPTSIATQRLVIERGN